MKYIIKLLHDMKPKHSCGYDNLSPYIIKRLPFDMCKALVHIFNLSLKQGEFISKFKIGKVIPIYKKGSKKLMENYRPVCLLPSISKLLEKIMYIRINDFLNKHNFFYKNQFGFRKSSSTEIAAIYLINKITSSLNSKMSAAAVFLDMSKAFDCIDHSILLYKLQHYGIRGTAIEWLESYFQNREISVTFANEMSSDKNFVRCGAPQGSILAPLLYLIYVNDMYRCTNETTPVLFADDTALLSFANF